MNNNFLSTINDVFVYTRGNKYYNKTEVLEKLNISIEKASSILSRDDVFEIRGYSKNPVEDYLTENGVFKLMNSTGI